MTSLGPEEERGEVVVTDVCKLQCSVEKHVRSVSLIHAMMYFYLLFDFVF